MLAGGAIKSKYAWRDVRYFKDARGVRYGTSSASHFHQLDIPR